MPNGNKSLQGVHFICFYSAVILKYQTSAGNRQTLVPDVPIVDGNWHTIVVHFHTTSAASEIIVYVDCQRFGQVTLEDKLGRVFVRPMIEGSELRLGQAGYGMSQNTIKVSLSIIN